MNHRFFRAGLLLLTIMICLSGPCSAGAGNEGDAWDQLKALLENVSADQVKPLEKALGEGISPSQLLDGMRAIEAIGAGDWKNAGENSAGFIIGLFAPAFGGYLTLHKAARETSAAVIENWVQDLYAHPAYQGLVDLLNRTVVDSAKARDPYLPSYLCANRLAIRSAMEAKESRLYERWLERPDFRVEELVAGQWAARIRQETGRGGLTERQIFNAFLVKAVEDQKGFVLTTFQRVAMAEGAEETRRALSRKAQTLLAQMDPPPEGVTLSMVKTPLKAGEDAALRYAYRVGEGARHSVRLVVKDAAGRVLFEKRDDEVLARTGQRQVDVSLGKIPPHADGKFTVELTVANRYGQSERARTFFAVVRDEAQEKDRLAYVRKVAAAAGEAEAFDLTMEERYRTIMTERRQVMDLAQPHEAKIKALNGEFETADRQMKQKLRAWEARMDAAFKSGNKPSRAAYDREKNALQAEISQRDTYFKEKRATLEREWESLGKRLYASNRKVLAWEKEIKDRYPHLGRYSGKELIARVKDWSNHLTALNVGLKTTLARNDLDRAEAVIGQYGFVVQAVLGPKR